MLPSTRILSYPTLFQGQEKKSLCPRPNFGKEAKSVPCYQSSLAQKMFSSQRNYIGQNKCGIYGALNTSRILLLEKHGKEGAFNEPNQSSMASHFAEAYQFGVDPFSQY